MLYQAIVTKKRNFFCLKSVKILSKCCFTDLRNFSYEKYSIV